MEAGNREVKDWLTKVRTKEIALPRFQRGGEAWGYRLIEGLLTSVIRDLPIGSALILGVGTEIPFVCRDIVGAPEGERRTSELLLDGQQRLTALWRSLNDNYHDRTYFVDISKENEEEKTVVISENRRIKNGRRYPLWADLPKECWERKKIPVKLLNPDNESEYQEWAETAADGDAKTQIKIERIIRALREKVSHFKLPYLYLEPTTPKDVAINVFINLNRSYVRLTAFEVAVAQFEEATGDSLRDLVNSLIGNVREISDYIDPSDLTLSVSALFHDSPPDQSFPPNQESYLKLKPEKIMDDWPKFVKGSKNLVQFLEKEKIFDYARLPTESVLAPLVALWAEAPEDPDKKGNAMKLFKKYLWRAFFTTRYDRSVPTAVLQDYRKLKGVISGEAEETEIPCFDEVKYPLPDKEQLKQAGWPKRRDRLARAILLLTLKGSAEDIADSFPLSRDNIKGREYHHLYPVAWLKETGIFEEEKAYCALNCILITSKTNRKISRKEPAQYLLERCEASDLGEEEIRRRLKTHFVDYDLLTESDYEDFIEKRAESCEYAIKELCRGNPWTP